MELRRVADALLRSQSSPLSILLAPSTTARWAPTRQLGYSYKASSSAHTRRSISATSSRHAGRPIATTTSPAPPKPDSSEELSSYSPQSATPSKGRSIDELSQSLNWTSRDSPRAEAAKRNTQFPLSPSRERLFNAGPTGKEMLAALLEKKQQFQGKSHGSSSSFTDAMLAPTNMSFANQSNDVNRMMSIGKQISVKDERPKMKLNPSTGRSVAIHAQVDLGRGVRLLEMSCSRNKVRADSNGQRFHERGGTKRKRLRMMRWRKRFMEGFKATVGRVKQLRNQGW